MVTLFLGSHYRRHVVQHFHRSIFHLSHGVKVSRAYDHKLNDGLLYTGLESANVLSIQQYPIFTYGRNSRHVQYVQYNGVKHAIKCATSVLPSGGQLRRNCL